MMCCVPASDDELAARPKVEPAWLAQLSETSTYRAMRMSHVLGDGDNIMLGARLPGGHELTCLVYIDHNLGTLVKDAFVAPASIADMVAEFRRVTQDPDTRWDDISLADARAWVDEAIELAAITFPPLETETWPACRALVEWITRGLPEGGPDTNGHNGIRRPSPGSRISSSPRRTEPARRSRSPRPARVPALVWHRLRPRRPAALEPGEGRDPARRLDSPQDRGACRVPGQGARSAAGVHPLCSRGSRTARPTSPTRRFLDQRSGSRSTSRRSAHHDRRGRPR